MRVPPIDRNMAIIIPFLVVGIGLRIWGQSSAARFLAPAPPETHGHLLEPRPPRRVNQGLARWLPLAGHERERTQQSSECGPISSADRPACKECAAILNRETSEINHRRQTLEL